MSDESQSLWLKLFGDSSSAVDAMEHAHKATSEAVGKINESFGQLTEVVEKVQGVFFALAAVVGGGKFFKEAIDESNKMTENVLKLSRQLGITAEEANSLNTALGDVYSDSDTYISMYQRFVMQLRHNEDGLKDMGLATRDANGDLRNANDVFKDALGIVSNYKSGIDQTAAAQKLFGRSVGDVMKLQQLSNDTLAEAKEKNEQLGLVITQQNVAAYEEYRAAMNDVGDVMDGIMKTVGDAVMPAFTELAQYLATTGPYVIGVFKGAVTGLLLIFRSLQAVVKTVSAVIFEAINGMMDQLGNLSDLISAVLHGDWEKAGKAVVAFKDRWVQAMRNVKDAAVDAFSTAQEKFGEDVDRVWGKKVAATKDPELRSGNQRMGDLKDTPDKQESRVPAWEAELEGQKVVFQKEHDLREMAKEDELKYWQELLDRKDLTDKERVAITKHTTEAELAMMKDERQRIDQLNEESIAAYQQQQLAKLDEVHAANQHMVDMGLMTIQEMLQQDKNLEDQRFEITRQGVLARLELLKSDPTKNAVALQKLYDELTQVEQEHAAKSNAITRQMQSEQFKDWQGLFNSIGNAFGGVVNGLVTHTMTMGQAVKSLFSSLLSSVGSFLAQMVAKRVAAWATERALGMAGISMDAAKAGSGAAASQASIPYVGPILALAAMATVFAATMAMGSNVKSARGGFDIPAGVNPMTQLHEEEMVLPKEQANAVRDMASGGGQAIHLYTQGGDFVHKDDVVKLLKKLNRNFEIRR